MCTQRIRGSHYRAAVIAAEKVNANYVARIVRLTFSLMVPLSETEKDVERFNVRYFYSRVTYTFHT